MVRRSNRRKFSKSSVWVRSGRIHPLAILGVLAAVLIVVGVLVGAGMFGPLANRPNADQDAADSNAVDSNNLGDNGPNDLAAARDILRQTQTAMVQTESLETEAAIDAWQALIQAHGGDVSRRRNLAIARLLDLDKKASVVSNPASKPEEIASARASIASQLANTGQAIDAFAKDSGDDVLTTWMRDRIARLEAELVPAMSRTRSKERVGRLSAAITNAAATPNAADTANAADTGDITPTSRSQALILVGPLLDAAEKSSDAIDGLPDSLRGPVTAALKQASRVAPENLSLALQLAKFLAEERSPQAAGALRRSFDLSKAIHPTLQRDLRAIGKTPQSLIDQAIEDIQAQRWEDAEFALISWNNVLRGSELVKTDLKRLSPHPLDLVSLSGLRAAAARVAAAQPIAASKQPAAYQTRAIEAQHSLVDLACLDLNLDQTPEWITLSVNGRVSVGRVSEGGWEAITEVTLEGFERGIRLADLYVVDGGKRGRGAATGGSSHDTLMQLLVFGSAGIRLLEIDDSDASTVGLVPVTSTTGLEDLRNVRVVTLGDFEADGDLDLLVVTDQSMHLMVNRGNRTFFEAPLDGSAFEGDLPEQFRIVDLDRDLDLDVITVHPQSGRIGLLENLLHLQLRPRYLDGVEKLERLQNAWVAELDGDVAWDLVLSSADKLRAVTGITESAGTWRAGETFQTNIVSPVRWLDDLDADSYHEALLQAGSMVRFGPQPNGTWGIQKVAEDVLPPTDAADARDAFTSRDTNGDGWPDLGWLENQVLHVGISVPREDAKSVAIRFKGIDDNASGRVNHYAIGSVIEARFGPHYRAQVVTSPVTRFGMDGFETADLRAILPNGLTQAIRNVTADKVVEEKQTLKGSCPYLYAFDGSRMRFVTDCLWAAPLGLQVARGKVVPDRPWEYLKIDGRNIRPRLDPEDGSAYYDFRMTEELWEIAYFDHVQLTAVDHPADVDVWTNEKVGPPSIAQPQVFAFGHQQRHALVSATDSRGRDVTRTLQSIDQDYVQAFERRMRQGLCPPHHVELRFDRPFADRPFVDRPFADHLFVGADRKAYLLMTGWILPTDTSLNIQLDQNPDLPPIEYPSVWVPDADAQGGWRQAIEVMGFPGGKTKTIVVDVSDIVNSQSPVFQIRTNAQIYWDAASFVVGQSSDQVVTQTLELTSAEVTRHGFSQAISRPRSPDTYDYHNASAEAKWPPLCGPLTRLGSCENLLAEVDDRMVVIASGDEIRMRFAIPDTALPAGWQRDFILHSVGWDKDADLNTLEGQSSLPLPYQTMTQYPPPLTEADMQSRRRQLNADHLLRKQTFRDFWRRPNAMIQPMESTNPMKPRAGLETTISR